MTMTSAAATTHGRHRTDPGTARLFAENLATAAARSGRCRSPFELATAVGVRPATVQRWLQGKGLPDACTLVRLAEALDVSATDLVLTPARQAEATLLSLLPTTERRGMPDGSNWSVSKLTTYLQCPAKFYFRHIADQDTHEPMGHAALVGKAVHLGAEILHTEPETNPLDKVRDLVERETPLLMPDSEGNVPTAEATMAEVTKLFALYQEKIAPQVGAPRMVEQRLEFEAAGATFTAVFDLVDEHGRIRDLKTANRRPSAGDIADNLQATAYSMAYRQHTGEVEGGIAFDYLIRNKTPLAETYPTTRDERDHARFERITEGVLEAVAHGHFFPNTQSKFGCGSCAFRNSCRQTF